MALKNLMENPKRIALLLPDLRGGGAEVLRLRMAQLLAQKGYEPEFWLSKSRGELLEFAKSRFPVFDLGVKRIRGLAAPLARTWMQRRPAAVLADMWPNTVVAAACYQYLRLQGLQGNLVVCDHNTLSLTPEGRGYFRMQLLRFTLRLCYPWASYRVAVSDGVASDLASVSGIAKDSFDIIYNSGFNETRVVSGRDPWPEAKLRILMVGSFKEQKDHLLALEAFAKLRREDACLAILGDGELRSMLWRRCEQLGIQKQVLMPGFVPDTQDWYAHAHLFLLTSRWGGFGIVLVEALQHGLQIVSTNCRSGPAEILDHGRYGCLVPVGDSESIVSAIQQVLLKPFPNAELHRRAECFSPARMTDQYLKLLLGPKRPHRSRQFLGQSRWIPAGLLKRLATTTDPIDAGVRC